MGSTLSGEDNHDEWASAVGQGLLAFGQIEHAASVVIRAACPDISDILITLNLDKKLEIVGLVLAKYQAKEFEDLRADFKSARDLLETRNLIAHNPLILDFFSNGKEIAVESRIRSIRNSNKHYTLAQTKEFSVKATDLASRLVRGAIMQSLGIVLGEEA